MSDGLKPYPDYKDSGVEWLGSVPAHWELRRLRFVCELNPRKSEIRNVSPDTEVSFLPMVKIGEAGSLALDETRAVEQLWQGYTYFRDGDVILAKITPCFENGKGARLRGLSSGIGFGTTELHVLRPRECIHSGFVYYLSTSYPFRQMGTAAMYGAAGQQRVPEGFVKDFSTGIPGLSEQRAIAAFLDRETERIDVLIANKERQIELLEEKRAALISHAVTKGLDANVPMKDSGIEWLGEIPAHWAIRRLKYVATFQRGHDLPADERREGPVPVVSSGGISGRHDERRAAGPGIVTGRYGTIGTFHFVEEDFWPLNTTLYCINRWGNHARFLWYMLQNIAPLFLVNSAKSAVPGVDRNDLHPVQVTIPPSSDEQRGIATFLDGETGRIDALITKVQSSMETLCEYRTALISAAVTGKIDVRGEV